MDYYRRVSIFLALLLAILAAPLQQSSSAWASSYSCQNHCYGTVTWTTGGEYQEAYTDNVLAHLTLPSGTNAHLNNELWLVAPDANIEVGTKIGAGQTINCGIQCFFWADFRPQDTKENDHYVSGVYSSDYGHIATYQISKLDPSDWGVNVSDYAGHLWIGKSTSNTMYPQIIQLGGELVGTSGGSAAHATYQDNGYSIGNGGTFFTTSGSPNVNSPWSASWASPPNSSNQGGVWQTQCAC